MVTAQAGLTRAGTPDSGSATRTVDTHPAVDTDPTVDSTVDMYHMFGAFCRGEFFGSSLPASSPNSTSIASRYQQIPRNQSKVAHEVQSGNAPSMILDWNSRYVWIFFKE